MNECYRAGEKNQKLYKLINCIASMSALQTSSTFKELPSTESVESPPLKKESMKVIQKTLLDTLKSLSLCNGTAPNAAQPKSIMPAPPPLMIQDAPVNAEEEYRRPKAEDNEDSYVSYQYLSNSPKMKGSPLMDSSSLGEDKEEQDSSGYYGSVGMHRPGSEKSSSRAK
eukprot:TRINITY_DN4944_c0_g2_i2.p1 TRINITY_DN4944_c0_g2~~TRINITY_DN4944_c0_g2_i2.p1  ORF type:complete len:169 (+),score=61.24 TRINITY_DN4944_c0_g2_i2:741-1247(+)